MDRQIDDGILLSRKKKEILPLATTWINFEDIAKRNKSEKDKYCMILFMCGI